MIKFMKKRKNKSEKIKAKEIMFGYKIIFRKKN